MKQLIINPKEKGTTIKFGKLPIFTRSLTHWSDMDNVVQLKVEGRYYAIEQRPTPPSPLFEAVDKLYKASLGKSDFQEVKVTCELPEDDEIAEECKADVEEANEPVVYTSTPKPKTTPKSKTPFQTHYQVGRIRFERLKELERTGELAKCRNRWDICKKIGFERTEVRHNPGYNWVSNQIRKGFLSEELIKYNKQNSGIYRYRLTGIEPSYSGNKHVEDKTAKKKAEELTNELEQLGFTNLSENPTTLPQNDPRIWLKTYDYVIYKLFVYGNGQVSMGKAVSFDEVKEIFTWNSNKQAGRIANVALTHLVHKGVLEKAQPDLRNGDNIFSLTVAKGGQYARYIYNVVSNGAYNS